MRGEDPVVDDRVGFRWGHQRAQTFQEFLPCKMHFGGAATRSGGPGTLQREPYVALRGLLQTGLRERGPKDVPAQSFQRRPLPRRDADAGVQVVAFVCRATLRKILRVAGNATTTRSPAPQRASALHGRGHEQNLGVVGVLLERRLFLVSPVALPSQPPLRTVRDGLDQRRDLLLRRRGHSPKHERAGLRVAGIDPVQHETMEVDVEVAGGSSPLYHRYGACPSL